MKPKDLAFAAIALALVGALAFVWFAPDGLKQAPDVTVTLLDGREIALDELEGRPVLVTFWATTCPGCIAEMPHLVELHHDLAPRGLAVIGVAMAYDEPAQVREVAAHRQLPYHVGWDRDGSLAAAFGDVKLTPTSFLIDPAGRIVQQRLGEMDMTRLRQRIEGMLGPAA